MSEKKLIISSDLSLPIDTVTQTVGILARKGSGKSYCASVMAEEMLEVGAQVVIIDPVGIWFGLRSSADGKKPGFPILIVGGDHGDLPMEPGAGELVADMVIDQRISIILDLSLLRKNGQHQFVTAFAERIYQRNRTPMHIILDEADSYCPQKPQHGKECMLGAINDLVRRGRARGIGMTLITQRAAVINKDVLTQIECLICLRMLSPQDRAAVGAWVDAHGTAQQKSEFMESLASLPIGTAWFWSPGWLQVFKKIRIRTRRTLDSSGTPVFGAVVTKAATMAVVDLPAARIAMAETVEKAEANDPVKLRAQLKAQTTMSDALRQQALDLTRDLEITRENLQIAEDRLARAYDAPSPEKLDKLRAIRDQLNGFLAEQPKETAPERAARTVPSLRVLEIKTPAPPTTERPKFMLSDAGLSGGMRRILIVLAQRPGVNAKQLGVRAQLSSSSGTFTTYLSTLRRKGWITGGREGLHITPAGKEALGVYEPLPEGAALFDYWRNYLGGGKARILDALRESYPNLLTREEIGSRASIAHTSGTFTTYMSELRTLELVERGTGGVRMSHELA